MIAKDLKKHAVTNYEIVEIDQYTRKFILNNYNEITKLLINKAY